MSTANPSVGPTMADYGRWNDVINPSMQDAGKTLLLGLALGGGYRGMQGLRQILGPPAEDVNTPQYIDPPDEEEKRADFEDVPILGPAVQAFKGKGLTNHTNWPLHPALQVGAAGAGLYGGYRIADLLMDNMRKNQLKRELEAAKQEYQQTLSGRHKAAEQIDALYDHIEKRAWLSPDTAGRVSGISLLTALLAGTGTGVGTYQLLKKQNPQTVLSKARKQRQRDLMENNPLPVLVDYPTPKNEYDENSDNTL